jgi:hypothetical protein
MPKFFGAKADNLLEERILGFPWGFTSIATDETNSSSIIAFWF